MFNRSSSHLDTIDQMDLLSSQQRWQVTWRRGNWQMLISPVEFFVERRPDGAGSLAFLRQAGMLQARTSGS